MPRSTNDRKDVVVVVPPGFKLDKIVLTTPRGDRGRRSKKVTRRTGFEAIIFEDGRWTPSVTRRVRNDRTFELASSQHQSGANELLATALAATHKCQKCGGTAVVHCNACNEKGCIEWGHSESSPHKECGGTKVLPCDCLKPFLVR